MTKYKININRPEVSTEEIVQNKDFNIILKKFKREKRSLYNVNWAIIYLVFIIIIIIGFFAARVIGDLQTKNKPYKEKIELQRPE